MIEIGPNLMEALKAAALCFMGAAIMWAFFR